MKNPYRLFILGLLILTVLFPLHVFAQASSNIETLVQGNNQFAIDLYKIINVEEGNILFSPYSISTALALAYAGARGETAIQMADVLHFSVEDKKLHSAFGDIQTRLNRIQQQENLQLYIANSLWPHIKYPFLKEYLELARSFYQAEIIPVNYETNLESVKRQINSWVEQKTMGKIGDILYSLHPLTRLVLANAIYFKGDWVSKFKRSDTKMMPFYLNSDQSASVPMMYQTNDLNYGEDEILQILELPYTGYELSMLVLLPRETDGLQSLEEMLSKESIKEWSYNLDDIPVELYLPKFKMTFDFDLGNVLAVMGMTNAFDSGKADFSGMDGIPGWSYINSAVHKAFVDVNEEGTEAAAATVGGGCFPSGTEVLTNYGSQAIETVVPGTKVFTCDISTGEWTLKKVLKQNAYHYKGDMITIGLDQITIQATGNHPFYVLRGKRLSSRPLPQDVPKEEQTINRRGRWVEARHLKLGDVLEDKNNEGLVITALSSRDEKIEVYNLDVEDYHNYAVSQEGILVHNKGSEEVKPVIFRADHPFLFIIRDNLTGSILFMGRVSKP